MDHSGSPHAELASCALADLSDNTVTYARGTLLASGLPVLTIGISGYIGNDRDSSYDHAAAMIMAGVEAWDPAAVVLDLTGLAYTWGHQMTNVLTAPARWHAGDEAAVKLREIFGERPPVLPVAVVTSELCHDGLASLLIAEHWDGLSLHNSLATALAVVDNALISAGRRP